MFFRSILVGMMAAFAVSACMHLEPAPDFERELSREYKTIDMAGAGLTDNGYDAAYFMRKGHLIDQGMPVYPEEPETWNVPREERPELENAYDMLQIALVADEKRFTHPFSAAKAQASFDCWVEQSHRNFIPSSQEQGCRPAFYEAFCRMYSAKCHSAKTVPIALKDRIYRVYFDTDRSNIDAEDRKIIIRALAAYGQSTAEIVVAGHADRVGKADYNLRLSKARADAVRNALVKAGIPAAKITDRYFGESVPLVPTGDEVPSPSNRRVLIVVR